MFQFTYVEDYIEFIGGWRNAQGKLLGIFDNQPSPLSLARYDVAIVSSLAEQTAINNKGYTDKQGELAKKIVDKYRRQLSKLTPPVIVPDVVDQFRTPLRVIDRSKRVDIVDGMFEVRFPYDVKLIDAVKKQAKDGRGHSHFDHDRKIWYMSMTESNLNWVMAMKDVHGIQVSAEIEQLYNQMLAVEQQDHKICLQKSDSGYTITNAPKALLEYVQQNIGELNQDNILRLVDNAETLGYEVADNIKEEVCAILGDNRTLCSIVNKRASTVNRDDISLDSIVEYARLVNRLPVYVYTTGLPKDDTDEIKHLNKGRSYNVFAKLMVSYTETMIGSKKESWQINAEKIIYLR